MNVTEAVLRLIIADPLGFDRIGEEGSFSIYFAKRFFGGETENGQRPYLRVNDDGLNILMEFFAGKKSEDVTRSVINRTYLAVMPPSTILPSWIPIWPLM